MNHHLEAWERIKPHLFGEVLEVAMRTPWGFQEDMPSIKNVAVTDFLIDEHQADTIILHILNGEGEKKERVERTIKKALESCVKLIVLEHNPDQWNIPDIDYIRKLLPHHYLEENWGRNLLLACTTTKMLSLPYLSDEYIEKNLYKTFVDPIDEGIDKLHLIYTHTSEKPIDFDIPHGRIWWVIGGGLAYENMKDININILMDSTLKQVLYCAYLYEDESEHWKLKRMWANVDKIQPDKDYKQWRKVKLNDVNPHLILHKGLEQLDTVGDTIYTSTVKEEYWKHLKGDNNIMEAISEPRDVVKFHKTRLWEK